MISSLDRIAASLRSGRVHALIGAEGTLDTLFSRDLPGLLAREGVPGEHLIEIDARLVRGEARLRTAVLGRITGPGRYAVLVRRAGTLESGELGVLCGLAGRAEIEVFAEVHRKRFALLAQTGAFASRVDFPGTGPGAEDPWRGAQWKSTLGAILEAAASEHRLRSPALMMELLAHAARTMGEGHSANALASRMNALGHAVSDKTVKAMLWALEDALLISRVQSRDIRLRETRRTPQRFFLTSAELAGRLAGNLPQRTLRLCEIAASLDAAKGDLQWAFLSAVERPDGGRAVKRRIEAGFYCVRAGAPRYVRYEPALDPALSEQSEAVLEMMRIPDVFEKIIVTEGSFAPWRTRRGVRVVSAGDFLAGSAPGGAA